MQPKLSLPLFLLFLATALSGLWCTAQDLPVFPKATTEASKPKPTQTKTKIIYVERPASTTPPATTTKSYLPEMVTVQGSSFTMGSSNSENFYEKPLHTVTLSSFKISKYETTVAQYRAYCTATGKAMPEAPSWGWQDNYPIVNISYNDAVSYCIWLSDNTGKNYRLPTEAEWEYAARGGNQSQGYTYSGSNNIDVVAWYDSNSGGQARACGKKQPNELGIYDMSGNVWEWCSDWYGSDYYSQSPSSNPQGPATGQYRVLRGGCWVCLATYGRVARRCNDTPGARRSGNGFRVVLSL